MPAFVRDRFYPRREADRVLEQIQPWVVEVELPFVQAATEESETARGVRLGQGHHVACGMYGRAYGGTNIFFFLIPFLKILANMQFRKN